MHRKLSLKLTDMNTYLKCPLCKGYLIDSFTINECLHSFCKSCIVKYVKRKECCPVCKINILKEKMSLFLRRDANLQYIVYKLVPGLFKTEMKRRRQFYSGHPKAVKFLKKRKIYDKEAVGELDENIFLLDNYSDISLSIEYSETGIPEICDSHRIKDLDPTNPKCYLQCPATLTIDLLKKFLSLKLDLNSVNNLDIMYDDKPLNKDFTLMDIAYIYAWRRTAPMRLFYRIKNVNELISNESAETNSNERKLDPETASVSTSSSSTSAKLKDIINNLTNKKIIVSNQPASPVEPKTPLKKDTNTKDKENQHPNKDLNEQIDSIEPILDNKESSQLNTNKTNKETEKAEELNSSINHPNVNTSHPETALTITAMVASITKEKKPTQKLPPISTLTSFSESSALKNSRSSSNLNKIETISYSDKENEDEPSLNTSQPKPSERKLLANSNLVNNELNTSCNSKLSVSEVKSEPVTFNTEASTEKTAENSSNSAQILNDTPIDLTKPKPKKQYKTKKNSLPAGDQTRPVVDPNTSELNSTCETSLNKKAPNPLKKKSQTAKQTENPSKKQKLSNTPTNNTVTPKLEPTTNLQDVLQKQQQAVLAHLQQQQQQQQQNQNHQFYQQQISSAFTLPYTKNTISQPSASSTPSSTASSTSTNIPSNFQLMPMGLMNHFMSASKPEAYQWSAQSGFGQNTGQINQSMAQTASALMNQKYASSIFDYFKTQSMHNQTNFLNPSSANLANNTAQMYQQYLQNAAHSNYSSHSNAHHQNPLANLATFYSQNALSSLASKLCEKSALVNNQAAGNNNNNSDLSSNLSSCGSDHSGLDSLKETQMRISESCNLVNDL